MADVIFAGTPSRPALGMAEVKLVIDNAAGKIAVPMTEIEISRTIFRSGESEYRIGGQVVRLLDVQELLSESGIGRALHTVVGQGQLEEVLLAKPEDRRRYIEEAAGIAKHRRRKERAERKLAGLDHDLLRLGDVLAELRRQLKPLAQQAEMAAKHETLTAKADDLAAQARRRAPARAAARARTPQRTGGSAACRSGPTRAPASTRSTATCSRRPTDGPAPRPALAGPRRRSAGAHADREERRPRVPLGDRRRGARPRRARGPGCRARRG